MRFAALAFALLSSALFGQVEQAFDLVRLSYLEDFKPVAGEPKCDLDRKLVFAHHVSWHNTFNNYARSESYYEFSLMRDDTLTDNCKREIALAQATGIDGFLIDYAGPPQGYEMEPYLKAAEGTSFLVGFCLDKRGNDEAYIAWAVDLFTQMHNKFAKHPNYPKIDGKMVWSGFSSQGMKPETYQEIHRRLAEKGIGIFLIFDYDGRAWENSIRKGEYKHLESGDMFYNFVPTYRAWNGDTGETIDMHKDGFNLLKTLAEKGGKRPMLSLHPGYIGASLSSMRTVGYIPARGFDKLWDCFHACEPGEVNWVQLTTWNDFAETAIYPRTFDQAASCELVRCLIDARLRGIAPPEQRDPKLFFAALREIHPGTFLRLEVISAPIRRGGEVVLRGRLLDNEGNGVAELAEKRLSMAGFVRDEWVVKTAGLSRHHALVPEITASWRDGSGKEHQQVRRLPAVLLRMPWIENMSTVRSVFHGMADIGSKLSVSQEGELVRARVEFSSSSPIRRAILWRNDRPLGDFTAAGGRLLNLHVRPKRENKETFTFKVTDGRFTGSTRKFGMVEGVERLPGGGELLTIPARSQGEYASQIWTDGVDGSIEVKFGDQLLGNVPLSDIARNGEIRLGEGDSECRLTWSESLIYCPLRPKALPSEPLSLEIYSRKALRTDVYQVQFITMEGRSAYSSFVAPNCTDAPRKMGMIETFKNQEARDLNTGYLGDVDKTMTWTAQDVNRLCVREGLWNFDNGGEDLLGDRPIIDEPLESLIKPEGVGGSKCLVFKGGEELRLRTRVYPKTNHELSCDLQVDSLPEKEQVFISVTGWWMTFGSFTFKLHPDGTITVRRIGCAPVLKSNGKINVGEWTKLRFAFNDAKGRLYLNDKLVAEGEFPPYRDFRGRWLTLGDKETGFAGRLDNLYLGGCWDVP